MTDFLDTFGPTLEEMEAGDQAARQKLARSDKRICVCGHSARWHDTQLHPSSVREARTEETHPYIKSCTPLKQRCDCREFQHVMNAPDVRLFTYQTAGPADQHALSRGVKRTLEKRGAEGLAWVEGVKCILCPGVSSERLYPIAYIAPGDGTRYVEATYSTPINLLVCGAHRQAIRDNPIQDVINASGAVQS